MDTTAAAELGMRDPVAAAFWDAGPPLVPPHWADHGDDDLLDYDDDDTNNIDDADDLSWVRPGLPAGAASPHDCHPGSRSGSGSGSVSHSGFGRGRTPGAEPPQKTSRAMPDGSHPQSNGGPSHHSFSGGSSGHGAGTPSDRGNLSAAGARSPSFGTVGSSPSGAAAGAGAGAGAVGRGRGMGSIFYKTKLCSRFRSGNCPYNTNCNFAHGMDELRKPPPGWEEFVASQEFPPPSQPGGQGGSGGVAGSTDSQVRFHKTRPCKKYFGEGNCPYGEKCNFLHDEQSVPRAVREARETAVAASGTVVAASPKVETQVPTTNGNIKETGGGGGGGGSMPAGAATSSARPSNWKTRLCNKWETTGHCPFGDKCHFAHGSDELQRYGGLPDSNAPALSDSKSGGTPSRDSIAVSSHQRHQGGASSARSGSKGNTNWRGPNEISSVYGDWWVEDDDWQCGGTTTSHESTEPEGDIWRETQRRTPLPTPSSSTPKTVPFFRRTNSLEPSRQNPCLINGCASMSQQDGGVHKQTFQYEGMISMVKEGNHGSVLQSEHSWRSELR